MHAMTPRLKTGQRDPQIPKEARLMTGNEIWYTAPIRPEATMKTPVIEYPAHTQSQHSHQERPARTLDETVVSQISVSCLTDHPSIDVNRIRKPEGNVIPWSPQSLVNGNRIKIITTISDNFHAFHTLSRIIEFYSPQVHVRLE